MKEMELFLPEYPQKSDMWDALFCETRPILIYGMGNGADKLIKKFNELGISFSDIFASDGFVRGHSFHGVRVKSFSEIKELYSDFVIVLSFASNRREVLDLLREIDEKYDMYIPDMPVAGEEYFDKKFYNENYEKIVSAYNSLFDEESRKLFVSVIKYKLSGKMKYLCTNNSEESEIYSLIKSKGEIRHIIDGGAYNGDTLREAIEYFEKLEKCELFEPDKRNFKKLKAFSEGIEHPETSLYNKALWNSVGTGTFFGSGNRNSSINSTASHEKRDDTVETTSVDEWKIRAVDYIKYDVEGAEYEALEGSSETILRDKPALLVSAYHRSRDIFYLINYAREKYPFYKVFLRRIYCVPAWECDIILIPTLENEHET